MNIAHHTASIAIDTPKGKITAGIRGVMKEELIKQNLTRAIKKRPLLQEAMKSYNASFFAEQDPKLAGLRTFYFKLIHDKFPTAAKIMKRGTNQTEKLTSTTCTFGCNVTESIEHILECPRNPKNTEEDIINTLIKIDKTYDWRDVPLWYHHNDRQNPKTHTVELERIPQNKQKETKV